MSIITLEFVLLYSFTRVNSTTMKRIVINSARALAALSSALSIGGAFGQRSFFFAIILSNARFAVEVCVSGSRQEGQRGLALFRTSLMQSLQNVWSSVHAVTGALKTSMQMPQSSSSSTSSMNHSCGKPISEAVEQDVQCGVGGGKCG